MFFRFNRRFNILNVDDSFARLVSIQPDGDLKFEFSYAVSQLEAVQKNALTVNVSIVSRTIQRRPLLQDSHRGFLNTPALINNILTQVQNVKTSLKEQETFTVAFKASDISATINNEIVGQLRAGTPKVQIPTLTRNRLVIKPSIALKQDNETRPLMQFIAHNTLPIQDIDVTTSSSIELNTRRTMFQMMLNHGQDPSDVTLMTHRSVPAVNAFGGLLRTSRASEIENEPAVRLLHHYVLTNLADPVRMTTAQVQDDVVVHVVEQVTSDESNVRVNLVIPGFSRRREGEDTSHYLVKFDLIDGKTHATIDSIIKPLDVARHVQLYYTPRKAPRLKAGSSELTSRVNLEIKQIDPGATAVQVYKKTIPRSSVEIEDYTLIGTYSLTSRQQSLLISVEKPIKSPAIYRVVPVGQLGTIGFEYSNIVIRPNRYAPIKAISVNARSLETGVEIEVRQFPPSAVSVEVLARNLTIHEQTYRNVGSLISLIDDATRTADYVSVFDPLVSEGRVYEYVARVTYDSGLTELSGHAILEFIKMTPGKVDIRISDVQVINDLNEPNVTFNMRSNVLDENIDIVLALLKRQDIKEYFNGDIAKEREFLKSLVAHNVQRVELSSGTREDFGVIVDDSFNDKEFRKNNSVSPLRYGKKYRYEISTLLRAPETMFEQFVKEKVDEVTKKTYSFQPFKFLHPIALKDGVIVTKSGLQLRYSKEPMSHGMIGSVETVEVSFDEQPARVVNPSAARFNRSLNVITWKLEGSIDQVDHFLIIKDVHGVRTMIGKAHSEFEFGNCQYLHPVTSKDEGELRYMIVPVFNTYQTGISALTNSVIV